MEDQGLPSRGGVQRVCGEISNKAVKRSGDPRPSFAADHQLPLQLRRAIQPLALAEEERQHMGHETAAVAAEEAGDLVQRRAHLGRQVVPMSPLEVLGASH